MQDVYPLPLIEDALSLLEGSQFFSILDLQSGYWQVRVREADRPKTAFVTPDGLFQFNVLPFGLVNAPRTFQRMMDVLLAGLKWYACLIYIDDIVIFGRTFEEHTSRLKTVLTRIGDAGLKLKLKKCSFAARNLLILGHVVSDKGISLDPGKINAVEQFPRPNNLKETQRFISICAYSPSL